MPEPITLRLPSKYGRRSTSEPKGSTGPGGSGDPAAAPFDPPTLDFLRRTWTVSHSTLRMWRSARNVRITYGDLPGTSRSRSRSRSGSGSGSGSGPQYGAEAERLSDTVEYEPLSSSSSFSFWPGGSGVSGSGSGGAGVVKRITGVDTATTPGDAGSWDWRGDGWLFFVSSHWEVLGWGERRTGEEGGGEGELVERWVVTWFAPTVFSAEGVDVYSDRREGGSKELVAEVLAELGRVTEGAGKLGKLVREEMRDVAIQLPWQEA